MGEFFVLPAERVEDGGFFVLPIPKIEDEGGFFVLQSRKLEDRRTLRPLRRTPPPFSKKSLPSPPSSFRSSKRSAEPVVGKSLQRQKGVGTPVSCQERRALMVLVINRLSTGHHLFVVFPHVFGLNGILFFMPSRRRPGRMSLVLWRSKWTIVSGADHPVSPTPVLPRSAPPHPAWLRLVPPRPAASPCPAPPPCPCYVRVLGSRTGVFGALGIRIDSCLLIYTFYILIVRLFLGAGLMLTLDKMVSAATDTDRRVRPSELPLRKL